ncbi:MAG: hypothetical protein EHM18_19025, partial [Acidobacteria bacterium]
MSQTSVATAMTTGETIPIDGTAGRDSYGSRGGYESAGQLGYGQGYRDGFEKGEEDYRKRRSPELRRHGRYRDADHGYKGRFGPKQEYR